MKTARYVGWVIGMAVLVCSFFLPFWNLTTGSGAQLDTLYGALRFTLTDLGTISQWGLMQVSLLAYLVLGAALLVAMSGALGVFPGKAGLLGVGGMVLLTLGPLLLFPTFSFSLDNYGVGFWSVWGLSVANLVVGQAARQTGQKEPQAQAAPPPTQAPPPAPAPAPTPAVSA